MNENILLIAATALLNGAVTWGIVKTQLAWLRRDVDMAHERISEHDKEHAASVAALNARFDTLAGRRRTGVGDYD